MAKRPGLGRDLCQLGNDHLVVCLVLEPPHVGAALGVVADRAAEQHHRTTIGPHAPVVDLADRQLGVGETEPIVAVDGREHRRIVAVPSLSATPAQAP